jgi:transposase
MHKHFSEVAVLDEGGQVIDRQRLEHGDAGAMDRFFRPLAGQAVVAVEAVRNWYWLYEFLEERGVEVKLVHSRKLRVIAESKVKTDKIDALVLAQMERIGYLPQAYIPSRPVRDQRELLRYRMTLVRMRTGLKNRIHALLDKLNIQHSFSDLFGTAGRKFLAAVELRRVYREELDNYLELLDDVAARIETAGREIKAQLVADARAELLMTIPGVGQLSAHLLLCEIGDIDRFPSPSKLCAYGGIVPATRQSAEHRWQGRITHEGSRYIRWAMVEAACKAPSHDRYLGQFYRRVAARRGPLKARVAVARKLLAAVWHVLTDSQPYRPRYETTV